MKFQTASRLHFQLNKITVEADFVWSLPTNEWVFVAMVYDGAKVVIYRGTASAAAELITAKKTPAQMVKFGDEGALFLGNRRDRARSFDGWLDDFRFYTEAADPGLIESIRCSAAGTLTHTSEAPPKQQSAVGKWVLVTAPAFSEALAPLVARRQAQGFAVTLIETTDILSGPQIRDGDAGPLKEHLQRVFQTGGGPKYLLLAGTAAQGVDSQNVSVPMPRGTVGRMNGRPTDYGYALADATGRPTVAVGRLPARTVPEMQEMVGKTLKLEESSAAAPARNRLLLVQGNPGGGPLAEVFVNGMLTPRLGRLHPAWRFEGVSHNSGSAFYLPSAWLKPLTTEYMSQGQLFSVYLGHSNPDGMWSNGTNFMSSEDWAKVRLDWPTVFFTCGCFACQEDGEGKQAYGLAAIRNPAGPVAVIGAYGESYAAPGLLAADGLLRCCLEPPFPTRLADYWLAVQRGLAGGEIDQFTFGLLDMSDGTQHKVPLSVQRTEHLQMWTLLGDPALRLPIMPLTISLKTEEGVSPGKRLGVSGDLPPDLKGATVRVSLERLAGTRPADVAQLPPHMARNREERDRLSMENQRKVNHPSLATASLTADDTSFACSLDVPEKLDSVVVVVRAVAEHGSQAAEGVLKLPVQETE